MKAELVNDVSVACPTNGKSTTLTSGPLLNLALDGTQTFGTVTDLTHVSTCSGHGLCRSMREMAYGFNGLTLIRPPTDYYNWDADKLQGCLCDPGYEGDDCSRRSCPVGRDPSLVDAATVVKISLFSDYGNIPDLGIIDGSLDSYRLNIAANITLTTNKGTGMLYECSNQGTCNHDNGVCDCLIGVADGQISFRAISSNDRLHSGTDGNCGFVSNQMSSCFIHGQDTCNGNGRCVNGTNVCECRDGWFGLDCTIRGCPKGPAWVDEPLSVNVAHRPVECSNAGVCDKRTGLCTCRDGFIGPACERRDCVRDAASGSHCSGHGVCMSISSFSSQFGFSYGNKSYGVVTSGSDTWDGNNWHECVCSAKVSAGFEGDWRHPSVGASALISGVSTGAIPLPGWGNWDCSLRNCPKGDTANLECGGSSVGFCDRTTGSCICNAHYVSSNGTNLRAGNVGDCGYFSGIPSRNDAPSAFGVGIPDF
eukprot:gene22801-28963_t